MEGGGPPVVIQYILEEITKIGREKREEGKAGFVSLVGRTGSISLD